MKSKRKNRRSAAASKPAHDAKRISKKATTPVAFLLFGIVLGVLAAMLALNGASGSQGSTRNALPSREVVPKLDYSQIDGCRNVHALLALSNEELEKVDVLELNLAVAREIQGLENLDYEQYRDALDDWTEEFVLWLPTVEHAFHRNPGNYKNDINFFRLGMLAQFLDEHIGVRYIDEQKEAIKNGLEEIRYTDPADLFLFGLIDRKQGTCGNMPTLHVAIARRLAWPVTLACVKSHYVCRYDNGKVAYNIEATDTGRGGFGAGMDEEYFKRGDTTEQAVDCGSDLNRLTAREMLGVFLGLRARHYFDIDNLERADRDCMLARSLIPKYRRLYNLSVVPMLWRGESIFTPNEQGHPRSIALYIGGDTPPVHAALPVRQGSWQTIPQHEIDMVGQGRKSRDRQIPGRHIPVQPHPMNDLPQAVNPIQP